LARPGSTLEEFTVHNVRLKGTGFGKLNEVSDGDLDFDEDLIYAYRGELFTGIGYEESEGLRISEIHYVNGRREGVARGWYADGSLCEETSYRQNVLHGKRPL
jgi:antitoxin component YwqK of YwqJK toxin-antitoxin module